MTVARAFLQNLRIDTFPIVTDPQTEELADVGNFERGTADTLKVVYTAGTIDPCGSTTR